ncbi:MAG: succinate dehydrogenase, partial [Acutalibacteraceae bacterium]|nr:succinate dehydrogenase [Acutalibacteraceae bacterium]
MNYILNILRRRRGDAKNYRQRFLYEPVTEGDTVATALTELNNREVLADINGTPAEPVEWECSCLQKKCGA